LTLNHLKAGIFSYHQNHHGSIIIIIFFIIITTIILNERHKRNVYSSEELQGDVTKNSIPADTIRAMYVKSSLTHNPISCLMIIVNEYDIGVFDPADIKRSDEHPPHYEIERA